MKAVYELALALSRSIIDAVLCHRLSHRRFVLPNRQPLTDTT